MPKAKAKTKPAAKPRKAPVKRAQPKAQGLDPRVLAAIALALHDEQVAERRDEQLQGEASQWTTLARARGTQTRPR
jgi:hypothetical protein